VLVPEKLPVILAGLAISALVLLAFWMYLQNLLKAPKDEGALNFGTWFILAYGDALDFGSYLSMTGKWWLNFVPFSFAVGSIGIFLVAISRRQFGALRSIDWFCIIADLSISGLWAYFSNAQITLTLTFGSFLRDFDASTMANMAYQMSALIAFIPMWWSQMQGRELEHASPWMLWAFCFGAFIVIVGVEHQKWEELIYPGVNLFTHYMIGITALTASFRLRLAAAPLRF
jgi:hypothetical protein